MRHRDTRVCYSSRRASSGLHVYMYMKERFNTGPTLLKTVVDKPEFMIMITVPAMT